MASPETPQPRVAVVVLNYNGLEDTLRCLRSLSAIPETIELILVDNASEIDPRPDAQSQYPGILTLRTGENLGYAGGNNRGIELALAHDAEFVLILNNDTIVDPAIVRRLLAACASDDSLGIVGPVVNFLDEPACVMTDGVAFNPGPGTEFFHRLVVPITPDAGALTPVDIVNGCCMMVRSKVFRSVGLFDERLFIIHEESDLCLRAKGAGFGCAVLGETLVWHKGSSAFERSGRQLQRYFDARNLLHVLRRHTGRVGASRRFMPSLWHYLLYVFYRYDVEMDAGKTRAASAVAEGTYDGLLGGYGPYRRRSRVGRAAMRMAFSAARWLAHRIS